MDLISLNAQPREVGTSAARAVRRSGEVPCVLYGPHQEPVHFRLPILDLRPLIYTAESHRVALALDGEEYDCIVKKIDFHPVSDAPVHVDFYALTAGEAISITVPVQLVGVSPGTQEGGVLNQTMSEIQIRCIPNDIPGSIEVDISELGIGDSIHVSDLAVENVTIETDPSRTVVTIGAPMAEEVVEEVEDELLLEGEEIPEDGEGEAAEGEDGEEPEGA